MQQRTVLQKALAPCNSGHERRRSRRTGRELQTNRRLLPTTSACAGKGERFDRPGAASVGQVKCLFLAGPFVKRPVRGRGGGAQLAMPRTITERAQREALAAGRCASDAATHGDRDQGKNFQILCRLTLLISCPGRVECMHARALLYSYSHALRVVIDTQQQSQHTVARTGARPPYSCQLFNLAYIEII